MNEEQLRKQLGDMMLRAMNNKTEILAELMVNMESLSTMGRGLTNFEDYCKRVEDEEMNEEGEVLELKPHQAAQMIRVLSKTCRMQAKIITHLSCFAMIYGNGSSYNGDAAQAAMKFGKGDEALQAMIRAKFGPNGPFGGSSSHE